jgi:hypothetical protein
MGIPLFRIVFLQFFHGSKDPAEQIEVRRSGQDTVKNDEKGKSV